MLMYTRLVWKEAEVRGLRYYYGTRLEGLRRTMKNPIQVSAWSSRVFSSNLGNFLVNTRRHRFYMREFTDFILITEVMKTIRYNMQKLEIVFIG
jgi:hypothetical protein